MVSRQQDSNDLIESCFLERAGIVLELGDTPFQLVNTTGPRKAGQSHKDHFSVVFCREKQRLSVWGRYPGGLKATSPWKFQIKMAPPWLTFHFCPIDLRFAWRGRLSESKQIEKVAPFKLHH